MFYWNFLNDKDQYEDTSLWPWPFPHRYLQARWPVDVMELFPRFCCWTLIRLSHRWAWLCRAYWRYRSLIDWLIMKRSAFNAFCPKIYHLHHLILCIRRLCCSVEWFTIVLDVQSCISMNNGDWILIKLNSSSSGMKDCKANISMFPTELFWGQN